MKKITLLAISVASVLPFLLSSCAVAETLNPDKSGKTGGTEELLTLEDVVNIEGSLTMKLDEESLPAGWKVEAIVEGEGFAVPEPGTAFDLSNEKNSCFFFARTDPEIVQTQQLGMGDSFLTLSMLSPYLTNLENESAAEKLDNQSVKTENGDAVEIAAVLRVEPSRMVEIPDAEGNLVEQEVTGQNSITGKRLFAVNAEKYVIPEDLVLGEAASQPRGEFSSIPAFTAVLQCENKNEVTVETFQKMLNQFTLQRVSVKD